VICVQTNEDKAKHTLPTIRRIPDELWDEFKKILPREKPPKTVGRPIIPYRKVLYGILYILRTGCQWMEDASNRIWLWHILFVIGGFRNGINWMYSRIHGSNY
jgi:hypothetical protein